jgi:hypothetical protein
LAITGISVVVGALFSYTHNLLFGRQLLEPENYNVYNRMVDLVIHELVSDGTITKQQQKEFTADDPEQRYEATQKQVYSNIDRRVTSTLFNSILFLGRPIIRIDY